MLLTLNEIKKYYHIDKTTGFYALDGINLTFEKGEFVSIVGPSGCGKSTLLNIIAGLDKPTSGNLVIEGKDTKSYKKNDWDLYRKNNIGFVFQNFNLIEHLNALENVEIVMNLIGLPKVKRIERARELLKKVGLTKYETHKPSELSGGQKQRVAIARALANDPDIILADEPTGALDKTTGIEVMKLLKEVAKDKLIIMVTHNSKLANEYSNRIIHILDGRITKEEKVNEYDVVDKKIELNKKNGSMSFGDAFKLSLRNMKKKKGRIIITTLAGCIGILGIALVLGLGNGTNKYIDKQLNKFATSNVLLVQKSYREDDTIFFSGNINDFKQIEEKKEVAKIRPRISLSNLKVIFKENEVTNGVSIEGLADEQYREHLTDNYKGILPKTDDDYLMINETFAKILLDKIDLTREEMETLIGEKLTISFGDENKHKKEFMISALSNEFDLGMPYVYYDYSNVENTLKEILLEDKTYYDFAMEEVTEFEIVLENASDTLNLYNWISDPKNGGVPMTSLFGVDNLEGYMASSIPVMFKSVFSQLINIAQIVMIVFISVALVVSSILTAIVLYSSVIERKVEIGILKAVGSRNKDVMRVFEAEAILIGLFSGILGIAISFMIQPIVNNLVYNKFGIKDIIQVPIVGIPFTNIVFPFAAIIILVSFSGIIAAVSGFLPSRRATRMQVVDALRDE